MRICAYLCAVVLIYFWIADFFCMNVFVRVYVSMYVHIYTYIYTYVYIYIYIYIYIYTCIYMYIYTYIKEYIYIYIYMNIYINMCVYIYSHIFIYRNVYIYDELRSQSRRGTWWDPKKIPRAWPCKLPIDSLPLQQLASSPALMSCLSKQPRCWFLTVVGDMVQNKRHT